MSMCSLTIAPGLNNVTSDLQSSIVIGTTNVSVPAVASLSSSSTSISSTGTAIRQALIAFLIIASVGSGMVIALSVPAIISPQSRALVYAIVASLLLATTFQLLAAILLTAMAVVITSIVNLIGDAVGLHAEQGARPLLFVWLAWLFVGLAALYWTAVWFAEVRK